MHRVNALRLTGFAATAVAAVGLVAATTGATGAYFSDTHHGTISGSTAVLTISTNGGTGTDGLDLAYTNMLPGVPQTVQANFSNSGTVPQDVWIVFPNATALSALNNLGNFGQIQINSSGSDVFDSQNLNDNTVSCPPGTSNLSHLPHPQNACKAVPNEIKLASNVAPGTGGNVTVAFNYVSYLTGGAVSGPFNMYPVLGQQTTNVGDGTGSGLPYELVATQVGIAPGA